MSRDLDAEDDASGQRKLPLDVLIVEDSPILSERLAEMISDLPETRVVGVAATENAARDLIRHHDPDVVVLDLHLSQGTGFGVMRFLTSVEHQPTVIVLSSYSVPEYRNRARQFGVEHFLDKASDFHRLPVVLQALNRRTGLA
jgi:DNA-binding NarL/FixJ family response regulator